MYYVLVVAAVAGAIVVRRRGKTLVPFGGLLLEVVVATVVTFGATRYRAPLEVGLVVLSAVAVDTLWRRVAPGGVADRTPEAVSPEPEPAVAG